MMDVITGKTRPDEGTVFFGQTIDLTRLRTRDCAHRHRPQVPEADDFREPHGVREPRTGDEDRQARLAQPLALLDSAAGDRIAETLQLIRLVAHADRLAGLLSHGQKQWLEIGMLLMQEPKLLLLDEPVAGMTDEETERTGELFFRWPASIRWSSSSTTWLSSSSSAAR
jgi:urea transport system ATP-binding protein